MKRFEGKVALLSGAASGVGRACAERFASEGARVFGVDVDEAGLQETAKTVEAAGGTMHFARFDLSRRDGCHAAVRAAVDAHALLTIRSMLLLFDPVPLLLPHALLPAL